ENLQRDGLLNSSDIESLEKCVSCMSRKMARKPYSHQVKRAKDLLGLIHIDVCGLFRTVTRQGASYFVTFTGDFSRYPKKTMGYSFYYPSENKVFVARNFEFFENNLIDQEASRSLEDLEIIQEEDTNPSVDTSLGHDEDDQEINEPQSDINPIRNLPVEVYMMQPEGFVDPKYPNRVCKLKRSIYGLKQASSAYIEKILKRYFMEIFKRGTIPMQDKLKLSDIKRELMVSCYTDAGHLTGVDDLKSQTGYVFVLNGGVVDWKSTKQSISATSSTDSEYLATFDALKEAVWIRKFIYGLVVVSKIEEPITMYCDNIGAIAIANDHGVTKGARHFHAKVYYLRETIEMGDVWIKKIDTYDNLADPFTKALAFPKHSELTRKIGLMPASSLMGAWRKVKHSEFCWLDVSENRQVIGEVHHFRYIEQTPTCWRMKMIGIPHLEPNMVICMVYETAEAVKNEAYAKSKSDKNAMKKGSQAYRINEKWASLLEAEQKYVRYDQASDISDLIHAGAVDERRAVKQRQADAIRASWE
nr:hypothetical protein [Tanacetum cinerariifolium]